MAQRIVFAFLSICLAAFSIPPAKAQALAELKLTVGPADTGKGFRLTWTAPSAPVNYYLVFRAKVGGETEHPDSTRFQQIDSVVALEKWDYPPFLQPGGYVYVVRAWTASGTWLTSNPAFAAFPVFKLYAYLADSGSVKLYWTTPPYMSVSYYLLYRAPVTSAAFDTTQFARLDSFGVKNDYRDAPTRPQNGGSFAYRLQAVSGTGAAQWSNVAFVYIPSPLPPETFRLSAALDTSAGKKVVKLSWVAPSNVTVLKYYVLRGQSGDPGAPMDFTKLTVIDSTNQLSSVDSLASNASGAYGYVVRAKIGPDKFIPSNAVVILVGPVPTTQYIKLSGMLNDLGKPSLTWTGPEGTTFSWFYVYRAPVSSELTASPSGNQFKLVDSTTQTQYVDTSASASVVAYAYLVFGKTNVRVIASNVAIVVMQDRITLAGYANFDGGSIILKWSRPFNGTLLYYRIYRTFVDSTGQVAAGWALLDSTADNEYNDHPAIAAKAFVYYVQAVFSSGKLLQSNTVVVPWRQPGVVPFLLHGEVEPNGVVELEWNDAVKFSVDKYYVYRAALNRSTTKLDTTSAVFTLVDSTTSREIQNSPPLGSSNAFAYYVEARGGGQKARTNYLLVFIGVQEHDKLVFLSEPPRHGRVGTPYSYQPKVVSTDSVATFKWYLGSRPSGMTIDSATGFVQWTPSIKGWFRVGILVASSMGGRAVQEYEVAVAGGSGSVAGVVTDTLGNPVFAVVRLLKRDIVSAYEYKTATDSTGAYSFDEVDVGSYIAYAAALKGDFVPQWYYEKRTPDQATPIAVADSSNVEVDFRLKARLATLPQFNLTGRVTDTLNAPVPGALVVFARAAWLLNSAKNEGAIEQQSENFRDLFKFLAREKGFASILENAQLVFRTVTDTGGRYSLRMPRGGYIGLSFAQGYKKIFYNQKTDLLSADVMKLTKDTTGINFTLFPVSPLVLGSISGSVRDTASGAAVPSRVIGFKTRTGIGLVDSYFSETDTSGTYTLGDLPPGDYFILAVPMGNYAPSFYSLSGPTMRWRQATKVTVNGNAVSGIDVFVRALPQRNSGYTFVQGSVTTTTGPGITFSKASASVGVNGTVVYVLDGTGAVAGYGVSDATGSYTIPGLSPQTYTVYTDRIGYLEPTGTSASPTYDVNGNPQPAGASFNIDPVTTGVEQVSSAVPEEYALQQNYPNPFNPSTTIAFTIPKQERVSVVVYNILGQKVATVVERDFNAGSYKLTWLAKDDVGIPLSTGVYFYQIRTSSFTSTKKMILLK